MRGAGAGAQSKRRQAPTGPRSIMLSQLALARDVDEEGNLVVLERQEPVSGSPGFGLDRYLAHDL